MSDASSAGVLDASVFIASEPGRPLDASAIPDEVATTVVTLAELNVGVLAARTSEIRAQRLATPDAVADMAALPVDEEAARMWARLRIHLAETGRRVRINDLGSRPLPHRVVYPSSLEMTTSASSKEWPTSPLSASDWQARAPRSDHHVVRAVGFEPTRSFEHGHLRTARQPVAPRPQDADRTASLAPRFVGGLSYFGDDRQQWRLGDAVC